MNTLLGVLEISDFAIIGGIIAIAAGGAVYTSRLEIKLQLMERDLRGVQQKLDALLMHHGIELPKPPPSGLSPEVERLASIPETKIEAIKLYRQQNPGAGLAEAKAKIEAYYESSL